MKTNIRVRGVLKTSSGGVLLVKRTKQGKKPYWVFPGGGVEDADASFEAALAREVAEELGGWVTVEKLMYVLTRNLPEGGLEKEFYFLGRLERWSREDATGDEFTRGGGVRCLRI